MTDQKCPQSADTPWGSLIDAGFNAAIQAIPLNGVGEIVLDESLVEPQLRAHLTDCAECRTRFERELEAFVRRVLILPTVSRYVDQEIELAGIADFIAGLRAILPDGVMMLVFKRQP